MLAAVIETSSEDDVRRCRLVLGEHDLVLEPGEVAEFDTRTPHWFGATRSRPVEFLSLIGKQGEKAHVRKAPKKNSLE